MRKLLCFVCLLLESYLVFSCDCKTLSKSDNFSNAQYVFTGTVVQTDSVTFKVGNIEYLKGSSESSLIALLDNCSINPLERSSWLFYADSVGPGKVYVSQCSWSRKFINNYTSIPPPKMGNTELYYDWVINNLYAKNSQNELISDVNFYKFEKVQHEMDSLRAKLTILSNVSLNGSRNESSSRSIIIFSIGIIIIIGLQLFNMFK